MAERTIILHYHLFKNAGTSLDEILKDNFPGRWVTKEFPARGGNNTQLVEQWIKDNSDAVAFSSHTMLGPLPVLDGVRVISVLLLRDPIERIHSAYRFERSQDAETFGAVLAKNTDFEGYVRVRLALPNDRQCRNFQTYRLASMAPGPKPEIERARAALGRLSVVGRVEAFGSAVLRLKNLVADTFPDFAFEVTHANRTARDERPGSGELDKLLWDANRDDLALLKSIPAAPETAFRPRRQAL